MYYPSIYNDVIGPVMRGPSSSHCAAALRIGRLAKDLMDGKIEEVLIEFDTQGALATTHTSQGSDMGLFGGLLGWETTDERLADSASALLDAGIKFEINILDIGAVHPNTYHLVLRNSIETHSLTAISTGGGMIEVTEIDGIQVSMAGDYFETLVFLDAQGHELIKSLKARVKADEIILLGKPDHQLIVVKALNFLDENLISDLLTMEQVRTVKKISPVLPVLSHQNLQVPFITCEEMLAYNTGKDLALWELAVHYESARGNLSHDQVVEKMRVIVGILQKSILLGIRGTKYADRILGHQSGQFQILMDNHQLLESGMLNQIILSVTALMEVKSSMGVIVASPTAGSCGGLPGACIGAASVMGLSLEESTHAMLAAGLIGVFIAAHATFAAEVGGCQAECGAGSGMAAAALVTLAKGSTKQAVNAASMALQNLMGLICDPVANRVEVPCLGKNVMAASNALACANMAIADFDAVIPLDEVIETMERVGKSIPVELRCTALGGLSITKTSLAIENKLKVLNQAGS
ncbi:MAG: L-serine ammonia-lyase, iron-sulfur-dependent, subunit alpha [Chloroflexi bacterium]|nr:L-serine ammonia-lyase, iron-sulfur-dependent, subunit alpha [Chloroflexota bacterium]